MRILLLNQFFHPDSAATSQLLTDLAADLVARGHDVRVIAGSSSYALSGKTRSTGVEVHRVSTPRFSNSVLGRLASYAVYFFGVLAHCLLGPRPDCVVTMTTPPGLSLIGAAMKRFRGVTHVCWEMDMYPDVAVGLGVLPSGSLVTRLASAVLDFAVRGADAVIALGPCMQRRLAAKGVSDDRLYIVENWADGSLVTPQPFPPSPLTLLYSGNLGRAHDIETIKSVLPQTSAQWIFAGGGPLRPAFEEYCRSAHIHTVRFQSYCPLEDLGGSLARAHIGVVTQRPESLGTLVPSKTYGILASGRPVLFIGPRDATPAQLVTRHHCGWQIEPGDSNSLLALLAHLSEHPHEITMAGHNARQAFSTYYDKPVALGKLHRILVDTYTRPAGAAVAVLQ